MGVLDLSAYKPAPATLGDANQIANGMQAIQNCINALDNNNFAAGKIFDPLKLMQDGATPGQALVWNAAANGGTGGWIPGSVAAPMVTLYDSGMIGVAAASFDSGTFSSVGYSKVIVELFLRSDAVTTATGCRIRFNGDASSIYEYQVNYFSSSTAVGETAAIAGNDVMALIEPSTVPGVSSPGFSFLIGRMEIQNPADATQHKFYTGLSWANDTGATANAFTTIAGGRYKVAAALTRVQAVPVSGNWAVGSRMIVRGVV